MDYIKLDLIISLLKENPDNLDKACCWTLHKEYGANQHDSQGQMRFSSTTMTMAYLHMSQVFERFEHPPLYVSNFDPFYAPGEYE